MKAKIQVVVGAISLLALRTYTLVHTGGLLAHYVRPAVVGYVAAFGIEAAIVSLSLRIGDLRKSNQSPAFFLFVLVSVVVVSALANIAEGFATAQGEPLTLATVQTLDVVQTVIGLAATGLISLIVLALSEIIGSDVETVVREVKREQRKARQDAPKSEGPGAFPYPIDQAQAMATDQARQSKAKALDILTDILGSEPDTPVTELARRIGRSRSTVYSYLDELEAAGRIERNGTGVRVR